MPSTLVYTKEGKLWNFATYVSGHKEQHQILEQLEVNSGYNGLDDGPKVRHLSTGIHTDKLDTTKGQILGNPALQRDFDGCVNIFKAVLLQVANDQGQTFNASYLETDRDGKKPHNRNNHINKPNRKRKADADGNNDEEVEDRFYTPKEYAKLTSGQHKKLQKLCDGPLEQQAAATLTDIQRLTIAVASLHNSQEGKEEAKEDKPGAGCWYQPFQPCPPKEETHEERLIQPLSPVGTTLHLRVPFHCTPQTFH
jgi:hypothetical protein